MEMERKKKSTQKKIWWVFQESRLNIKGKHKAYVDLIMLHEAHATCKTQLTIKTDVCLTKTASLLKQTWDYYSQTCN